MFLITRSTESDPNMFTDRTEVMWTRNRKKPGKVGLSFIFGSHWYYRIKNNQNCADL